MTILVVPPGTLGYPISEGTASFDPYPENPSDPRTRWLVDVPAGMAERLLHNGGFKVMEQRSAAIPGMVRLRHPERIGCSFDGNSYDPDDDGVVLVPAPAAAELVHHGFVGAAERDAELDRLRAEAKAEPDVPAKPDKR